MKLNILSFFVTLATSALVALTVPVFAEDKAQENIGATAEGAGPGAAATLSLAQDLYVLGVRQGDALTVLSAARLAASVEVAGGQLAALDPSILEPNVGGLADLAAGFHSKRTVGSRHGGYNATEESTGVARTTTTTQSGKAGLDLTMAGDVPVVARATLGETTSGNEGSSDAPITTEQMFAKAIELAGDDEVLIGLIEDAQAETGRGRIGGAVQWLSRLPAGMTDVWEVPFYGNSYAEIAIVGDGDANLDVAVTDENGNVICYDVSWSDKLYCDWTPAWDGYFYITVQNMGGVRNSYYLMTN